MTEREWQRQVTRLLGLYGWDWYHTYDSRRSREGFPDLVCWHADRGVIFVELKTDAKSSRLSQAQCDVIDGLREAGARCFVWRPRDLDEVVSVLAE